MLEVKVYINLESNGKIEFGIFHYMLQFEFCNQITYVQYQCTNTLYQDYIGNTW